MTELPTGTVTFLFTVIEGSTRLLQELGDGYRAVQDRHQEILREAIRAEDGHEIRTEGDAFLVVFRSPIQALKAAVGAQRGLVTEEWSHGEPLRVRMGMHTGELSFLAFRMGDLRRARAAAVRSLEGGLAMGGRDWSAVAIQALAVLSIHEGNVERGVRLAGAADRFREIAGGEAPPAIVGQEEPLDLARGKLPPERIESLWEEGRALTLEQAAALAREDP
jgi:Adenylate and Guanylate cyclase catalytic domain